MEKMLSLVVQGILLYSEVVSARGSDGTAYRNEKISTLETNINKRGARQGRYMIPFDASSKRQQIKLNKDHAWVILSPPPVGKEGDTPMF